MIPEDLRYTSEHEWVRTVAPDSVRIGITDYAQDSLGDIVYVQLPEADENVHSGTPMGELESTKSVSDLFAPVSGSVVATNDALVNNPELCNSDPYGEGWIIEVKLSDPDELDALMTASDYAEQITSQ